MNYDSLYTGNMMGGDSPFAQQPNQWNDLMKKYGMNLSSDDVNGVLGQGGSTTNSNFDINGLTNKKGSSGLIGTILSII